MTIEENKQVVTDWIQSGCNYEQCAKLYSEFGKNKFLRKDFTFRMAGIPLCHPSAI
jgi:hypothetical protein